jgi:hypothetical protein
MLCPRRPRRENEFCVRAPDVGRLRRVGGVGELTQDQRQLAHFCQSIAPDIDPYDPSKPLIICRVRLHAPGRRYGEQNVRAFHDGRQF